MAERAGLGSTGARLHVGATVARSTAAEAAGSGNGGVMPSVYFDPRLDDAARRHRLYSGDLVILSPTPSSLGLVQLARQMVEKAFAPHDPRRVHEHLDPQEAARVLSELKPAFIHHPECKRLIAAMLHENGVDLDKAYFDVPRLRSAFPSHYLASGIAYAFHPHRDTWYSAPMCQLNWWIPIFDLDPDHAMGFYPSYFTRPVLNNSEIYNYYQWNSSARANAAQHVKSDTREQPKPQQELEPLTLRYLPPPGGTIVFSGAQLHETVPNTTDLVRYSIDFRTVHLDDVTAGTGAVNIDTRCTGTTMRDYARASDLQSLPDEVIQLYDDGTGREGQILRWGEPSHPAPQQAARS